MILRHKGGEIGFWNDKFYYWFWCQDKTPYKVTGRFRKVHTRKNLVDENTVIADRNLSTWFD